MLNKSFIGVILLVILVVSPLFSQQYPVNDEGKSPFVEVVKNITESVVNIQVEADVQARAPGGRFPFDDDFFRFFFGPMPETRRSVSMGSGFIFRRQGSEVFIITNNHVVDKSENHSITVTLADQARYSAEVVGLDPQTDIAVIKINVSDDIDVTIAPLGDSANLDIGDWAIAIGNPFGQLGLERTVTVGVISATSRAGLDFGRGSPIYQDYIQTDAAINPGNSGGPLLNLNGEVIGVNAAITSTSGGNIGIGFAIPINLAKKVVDDLLELGRVSRAYLGILPQEITADLQQSLGLERIGGVLVARVEEDTPAEKGGLRNGDVITEFNEQEVRNVARFRIIVANTEIGKRVPVTIYRNNQQRTIHVTLTDIPKTDTPLPETIEEKKTMIGLEVEELSGDFATRNQISAPNGVVVTRIERNTPAEKSDLSVGDVIIEIDRKQVNNVKDYNDFIEQAKDRYEKGDNPIILMYVQSREGVFRFITVNLGE
jgi:serine protease Do